MKIRGKRALSIVMAFMMTFTGIIPAFAADIADGAASAPLADHVVINQVYGGGGNSGATYSNDFIELYNPTDEKINVKGWSVQYASKSGPVNSEYGIFALDGEIAPKSFYLIQCAMGNSVKDKPLPKADAFCELALGGSDGKVVLVKNTEAIVDKKDTDIIDFVGYGAANEYEGSAPTGKLSATSAAIRNGLGVDSNDNAKDFTVAVPKPNVNAGGNTPPAVTKCAAPTASVAPGMVNANTVVKFETTTSGAAIEFNTVSATDNSWTSGSAVTVTADTTYYVRAVKDGLEKSNVATFAYLLKDPNQALTVKEVLSLPSDTEGVIVKGTLAYFAQSYSNPVIYSEVDGKTYALYIFGAAPKGAKIGDEIKLEGKYTIYNGLPELTSVKNSSIVGPGIKVTPKEMTIKDVLTNGSDIVGQIVKLKDVTLGEYKASGSTQISDATGKINIYKATPYPVQVVAGDVVDVYAMVAKNNSTIQLFTGTKEANGYNVYDVVNDIKAPVVIVGDSYPTAKPGMDYTISVKADDNKGVKSVNISYTIGTKSVVDQEMAYDASNGNYAIVIKGSEIPLSVNEISFKVTATDVTGLKTETPVTKIAVDPRPQFVTLSPARGSATGEVKNPVISVTMLNEGKSPEMTVSLKKEKAVIFENKKMTAGSEASVYTYKTAALEDGLYTVTVTAKREDGSLNTTSWNFTVGTAKYRAYFGQLHAHTAEYSDGSGTLADGLSYLASLSDSENVNFVSFTDHSNYFDTTTEANVAEAMNDKSKMSAASLIKWNTYVDTMKKFNAEHAGSVLAFPGYEMTWSGGPGHINTFNSVGLVSRNNTALNSKAADAGMKAYYDELVKNPDPLANLSQFNHPGATFGTFADFSYWSPTIDNKMVAVEVGNGEGAIGSGGYFPSYTEYTKALDKGWHVAPTNNQDNHKGKWGNANNGRTVIITNELTEKGLLTGLKEMSVYATEDKNLNIQYTVNGQMMGTIVGEVPSTPLQFSVIVDDPDNGDTISKIEIVTNSGRVAASKSFDSNVAEWNFEIPASQGYYYVRVTQADKNIAVTAPIWFGQAPRVGINSVECSSGMPVTNEAIKLKTKLFNNELQPVTLKSIEYAKGSEVIKAETPQAAIASTGSYDHEIEFTPTKAGRSKITVTAVIEIAGQERSFSQDIEMNIRDGERLVYVGIDASHHNEYVDGNYKASMGNFANLAVASDVRVVELKTSEELIAATQNSKYKMIVLTPPTRRNGNNFLLDYKSYSKEEVAALKAFAESGKTIIITGWADYYENYTKFSDGKPHELPADQQMAAQQNLLLEAMGSSLRVSDDEIIDNKNNGGQAPRLYLKNYNMANPYLKDVLANEQVYSNYGGSTVYAVDGNKMPTSTLPSSVSPMVYAFSTSESVDADKDGTALTSGAAVSVPKYSDLYMVAASEKVTYTNGNVSNIIVAGSAFMSNFEIQATLDSYATPAYSNYTILENIVNAVNPPVISDIAKAQAAQEGEIFTIQGIVTSNASGYDRDTAFFDTVYVQDATAGIDLFPVAGNIKAGQTIRVTGVTSSYNGERQLNVLKIVVVDSAVKELPAPKDVTTAQAAKAAYLGSIVRVSGKVQKLEYANNVVESIFVMDNSGIATRVFIDGYITKDKTIANLKEGATIMAVGLSSISTEGARIRVRDRADVICTPARHSDNTSSGNGGAYTPSSSSSGTAQPTQPVVPTTPKVDTKAVDAVIAKAKASGKLTDAEKAMLKDALKAELKVQAIANTIEERQQLKESIALLNSVIGSVELKQELLTNPEALSKAITAIIETLKKELAATGVNAKTAKPVVTLESAASQLSVSLQATDLKVAKENGADLKVATADASVKVASADLNADKAYKVAIEKDTTLKATAPKHMAAVAEGIKLDTEFKTVQLAIPVDRTQANKLGVFKLDEAKKTYVLVQSQIDSATGNLVVNNATNGQYVVAELKTAFSDTTKTWAKDTIGQVSARRIMVGVADDQFAPGKTVTKAEFATALLNMIGKSNPEAQDWKASNIAAANQLGFGANFLSDKTADMAITREEMTYMLAKAYALQTGYDAKNSSLEFKDAAKINKTYQTEIAEAQKLGLVKGMTDGTFKPVSTGTRAEAAQMLLNLANSL